MPFLSALVQSEIQTALSSFWTWVTNFIFYDDNRFAKCASSTIIIISSSSKYKSFK